MLDDATRKKIRELILAKCDSDKNGKLDRRELQRGYHYIRRYYQKQFDTNKNGRLDGQEYGAVTAFLRSLN